MLEHHQLQKKLSIRKSIFSYDNVFLSHPFGSVVDQIHEYRQFTQTAMNGTTI